ncbi:hypothetical protein FPZ24_13540 [Sphingomonas panacisoli]|uniref:Uncharacterized protein n=1 Tax=Sphingomonas panacisoli TaxID=1813879 RepID=A0A5B8LLF8_9SPHN|nr:hypothetical protein [Sphingomonas panacisoli]QDZ08372.1 hypothetical protein FPZ24_13540 [Sphingomonas panacisoli]
MTSFSVDYNRVVADTRDRMILLNVVRSAYREPTYYTAFTQIEGSLSMSGSVGADAANLIGPGPASVTPTVSGSFANAPTFAIIPLNSDEFSKGMLAPIGPDTIRLFLSQGWRPKMLAPLVVQKVECLYQDQVIGEVRNEPGGYTPGVTAASFEKIVFYTGPLAKGDVYTATVPGKDAMKLLAGGALDKFDITETASPIDPTLTTVTMTAKADQNLDARLPQEFASTCRTFLTKPNRETSSFKGLVESTAEAVSVSGLITAGGDRRPDAPRNELSMNIVFRSTDGIVYYLGERLRATMEGKIPDTDTDGDVLFRVGRDVPGAAAVAIDHRGSRWSIYASDIGDREAGSGAIVDRSLQVIALLNQLISAQTSTKEFSRAPATVRVR